MPQVIRGKAGLIQHFLESKERAEMRIGLTSTTVKDREKLRTEANLYQFLASWLEGVVLVNEDDYDKAFGRDS